MPVLVQGYSKSTARHASIASPRSVTALLLPQETVFNLSIDLVQPLLGSLSAVLIRRDLSFQLRNAIFSGSKLMRKLLSHVQRVSAVLFSRWRRPFYQGASQKPKGVGK